MTTPTDPDAPTDQTAQTRPTTLVTPRLTLRAWTLDDVDFLFDLYSRWDVQRYMGRMPRVMADRDEAVARVERWAQLADDVFGVRAVTDTATGRPFGSVLLKDLPASGTGDPLQPSGDIEIGWHLHPDAWGHGYASEAATRVLELAFERGLPRVLAVTHPQNTASQAVARRIGMRDCGPTDAYYDVTCALFVVDRVEFDAVGLSSQRC